MLSPIATVSYYITKSLAATFETYFPEITDEHQKRLHKEFKDLISEESKALDQFKNSMIDFETIVEFNSKMVNGSLENAERKKEIFAIDFGGSSLKLSTVKITYTENMETPEFASLNEVIYPYLAEDRDDIKRKEWYVWVSEKVKQYFESQRKGGILNDMISNTHISTINPGIRNSSKLFAAFTFSFPIKQEKLNSGTVLGKGKDFFFLDTDFLNPKNDIVELLNGQFQKDGINVEINCLLNDVVATWAAAVGQGMVDPVSLIVGTGTNAGFVIKTPTGEHKIINSEMAQFPLPEEMMDMATLEIIKRKGNIYQALEVSVAGLKFVEIVNMAIQFITANISHYDLKHIVKCIESTDGITVTESAKGLVEATKITDVFDFSKQINLVVNPITDYLIKKIALKFKERAYKILAPILVAASNGKNFNFITNGSVIAQKEDSDLLLKSIKSFLKLLHPNKDFKLNILNDNKASLYGAAFVSLAVVKKD